MKNLLFFILLGLFAVSCCRDERATISNLKEEITLLKATHRIEAMFIFRLGYRKGELSGLEFHGYPKKLERKWVEDSLWFNASVLGSNP